VTKTEWRFETEGFIEVQGGRVWYGTTRPTQNTATPLLVLHGGPGMSHDYLYPLTDLADERQVVFYDQLDAGRSDRPNEPRNWVLSRFLDEVSAVRDALGLSKVCVFGNSWGGTVAAAYAATRPDGLDRLVLSSPLISTDRWIADNQRHREQLPASVQEIMASCEAAGQIEADEYQDAVALFYSRHFCRVDPWPLYVNESFDVLNEQCYSSMWGPNEFTCDGVLMDYDGSASLASIEVPVLMTCGEFDEATPAACRAFSALIPNCECDVFADSSHLTFVEARASYIATLRRFLSGTATTE